MATTPPVDRELYPLSTEQGVAIPLDVMWPLAIIPVNYGADTSLVLTVPEDWKICSVFSTTGCYLIPEDDAPPTVPAVSGVVLGGAIFSPANATAVVRILPGDYRVIPAAGKAGLLVLQHMQKYAGIALRRNITSK